MYWVRFFGDPKGQLAAGKIPGSEYATGQGAGLVDLTDFVLNGGVQEKLTIEGKYNIEGTPTDFKVLKRAFSYWNKNNKTLYCTYKNTGGNNLLFTSNATDADVTSTFVCKVVALSYRFEDVNVRFSLLVQYISPS